MGSTHGPKDPGGKGMNRNSRKVRPGMRRDQLAKNRASRVKRAQGRAGRDRASRGREDRNGTEGGAENQRQRLRLVIAGMGSVAPVAHAYRLLKARWDQRELAEERDKVIRKGGPVVMQARPKGGGAVELMPSAVRVLAKVVASEVWKGSGGCVGLRDEAPKATIQLFRGPTGVPQWGDQTGLMSHTVLAGQVEIGVRPWGDGETLLVPVGQGDLRLGLSGGDCARSA